MKIFDILLVFAIGDSIGISYKNCFNDIFKSIEDFDKEELESYGSCNYETNPYSYTDNVEIILIFLEHFINEHYDVDEEKLRISLNSWFDKFEPFNIDGALRMKIFSNNINKDNYSNFFISRIILPLIVLKNNNFYNFSKEEIKKRIYFISRFTNKDKQFLKSFHFVFDLIYEETKSFEEIFSLHEELTNEIQSQEEEYNDHLYSTLKILIEILKNDENDFEKNIKKIIIRNINPELIIPLYLSLLSIRGDFNILNYKLSNFLDKNSLNNLRKIFDSIYIKVKKIEEKKKIYDEEQKEIPNEVKERKRD